MNMLLFDQLKKTSLLKNASVYTGANLLSALVPFLCMPILTRYLTPEDYGIVAVMGSIISFLIPFVGLNVDGAIAAHYYSSRDTFEDFVKACNSILVISSFFVITIILLFADYIAEYTLFPGDWLWTVVMICISQFIYGMHLTLLQIRKMAINYGILQVLNVCFNVGLSIFLVVILNMNWQGRVLAQCITMFGFMVVSIVFLYKNKLFGFNADINYFKEALTFGIPLIPHTISGSIMTVLDRIYVANIVDLGTAGLFVIGAQIGGGVELLVSSFNKAYVPWLYDKLSTIDTVKKYRIVRYTYFYFIMVLLLAIAYSYVAPLILEIFVGEKFLGASSYVWAFALSGALSGMYYMVVNYIFYSRKTVYLMLATFLSALLHAFISYYFTLYYGILGTCFSVVLSHFIIFILVWYLSNKVYKMPWVDIRVFKI